MDIRMVRGDTPSFTFTVRDPNVPLPNGDPSPVDLTGASIRFTVQSIPDGADVFQKSTGGGTVVILNQTTNKGQCRVDIANGDTASLVFPAGLTPLSKAAFRWRMFYDLQVVKAGKIMTPASGILVVKQDYTNETN